MKQYTALALTLGTVCALHAQPIITGQNILLGDGFGSTYGGAWIQYSPGSMTVTLGEIATPNPLYDGVGWIAEYGGTSHLLLPLQPVGLAWGGMFSVPGDLQLYPAQYFLAIAYGGYASVDITDTVVEYRSAVFQFIDPTVPGPVIPGEDPVVYPPNPVVPEPGASALLAALLLVGFAGYRRWA